MKMEEMREWNNLWKAKYLKPGERDHWASWEISGQCSLKKMTRAPRVQSVEMHLMCYWWDHLGLSLAFPSCFWLVLPQGKADPRDKPYICFPTSFDFQDKGPGSNSLQSWQSKTSPSLVAVCLLPFFGTSHAISSRCHKGSSCFQSCLLHNHWQDPFSREMQRQSTVPQDLPHQICLVILQIKCLWRGHFSVLYIWSQSTAVCESSIALCQKAIWHLVDTMTDINLKFLILFGP